MFDMLRIVVAGTLLLGWTAFTAPAEAAGPSRVLPRTVLPVKGEAKGEPCRPSWPYRVPTCLA